MKHYFLGKLIAASIIILTTTSLAQAGEVSILAANFHGTGAEQWSINVTLKHLADFHV